MKKISMSELIALPSRNQQEAERMLNNYAKHLQEYAELKEGLKLEAIRQRVDKLHGEAHGNPSAA